MRKYDTTRGYKTNKPVVLCALCKNVIGADTRVQINNVEYKGKDANGDTMWRARRRESMHAECYDQVSKAMRVYNNASD